MTRESVVAVFERQSAAHRAVKQLAEAGLDMQKLSIVGKGCHTEEKIVGVYSAGDRVMFWGTQGAFWGGLWGLLFGAIVMTIPVVGYPGSLGHLAPVILGAVGGAVGVGGLSALGAALYSLRIPEATVLEYESALKADGYLIVAHGSPAEVNQARSVLAEASLREAPLTTGAAHAGYLLISGSSVALASVPEARYRSPRARLEVHEAGALATSHAGHAHG